MTQKGLTKFYRAKNSMESELKLRYSDSKSNDINSLCNAIICPSLSQLLTGKTILK